MNQTPHQTPGWVKVLAAIAVVLVVLIAVMLLSGHNGPGRHLGSVAARAPMPAMQR
jgi:hypothetical protein